MNMSSDPVPSRTGSALLLTGGGARAAYQVGVLQGIAELHRSCEPDSADTPFDIIVGTSAGAINATALACRADDFRTGVSDLARVWSQFHAEQVYHASIARAAAAGTRWLIFVMFGWLSPRLQALQPHSLLDNEPLRDLLQKTLSLERIPQLLAGGHLRALAVTTSCYSSGEHLTFYDGVSQIHDWTRVRRRAVRTHIGVDHLMASSALPFIFPAARIEAEGQVGYYGDGSMRQTAPIAPVIHLGAKRVLVIGVGEDLEPMDDATCSLATYPSLAQVANHALSSIFLDTLAADAALLHRVNRVLALIDPMHRAESEMQPVDLLVLEPSERIDQIAARQTHTLPRSVRILMRALGMRGGPSSSRSSALASYLLFEPGFTTELMRLGHRDAIAQRQAICQFFGWKVPGTAEPSAATQDRARVPG